MGPDAGDRRDRVGTRTRTTYDFHISGEAKIGLYLKPPSEMALEEYLEVIEVILEYPELEQSRPSGEIMGIKAELEVYDGRPIEVAPDATAFFHRNTVGDFFLDIFTRVEAGKAPFEAAETWMTSLYSGEDPKLHESLGSFELDDGAFALWRDGMGVDAGRRTFEAYQNYVFTGFGEGENRLPALIHYFGNNVCRLLTAKRMVDPEWLLDFPHGLPPLDTCAG